VAEERALGGHTFICHVCEDADHAEKLCGVLAGAGIPIWRDTANLWPGEDWRAKIRSAITRDTLVFLACFSRRSIGRVRSYQNEELALAIDELRLRRPGYPWLIPVRFDDCEVPDWEIGGGRTLGRLYQADLFGASYRENADRLVTAIKRMLGTGDESSGARAEPERSETQSAKYVVNISDSANVQIGDGNIQHNVFDRPRRPGSGP
jgi:hypothetical protein